MCSRFSSPVLSTKARPSSKQHPGASREFSVGPVFGGENSITEGGAGDAGPPPMTWLVLPNASEAIEQYL
jgi:hypothetical protein